ncbi:MAG: hypothetical protein JWM41_3965 [Gemmatimonadetes bacterium]|nr:hypothetical protein [Gemmatimonadota bacterium]
MTDRANKGDRPAGDAAERPKETDTSNRRSGHTGAGQEATKGKAPAQHDTEHQSNYGGGGANGGSDTA